MVGQMKDSFETDVFGVEKEDGKGQGIIAAVYQSVCGQDAGYGFQVPGLGMADGIPASPGFQALILPCGPHP